MWLEHGELKEEFASPEIWKIALIKRTLQRYLCPVHFHCSFFTIMAADSPNITSLVPPELLSIISLVFTSDSSVWRNFTDWWRCLTLVVSNFFLTAYDMETFPYKPCFHQLQRVKVPSKANKKWYIMVCHVN